MFTKKRKSTYKIFVSAWFLKWTSLGLNQGPPDYESVALTNWATSPEAFFSWKRLQRYILFLNQTNVWLRKLIIPTCICVSDFWETIPFSLVSLGRKSLWLSKTRRKQIRPIAMQAEYFPHKQRQWFPLFPIKGISTNNLCPNDIRL